MAVERIDSIYNIPAIEAEHSKLQTILETDAQAIITLYENIEKFSGKSNVATIGKNWENVTTSMVGAASASEALAAMQKQLNEQLLKTAQLEKQLQDAVSSGNTSRKKRNELTDDEIRLNAEASESTRMRKKEIMSQSDAYKALDLEYQKAAANAKRLQAEARNSGNPQDKIAADLASAQANSLNNALKRIDSSVGESRRKVGDYTGALRILEEELAEVNSKLAQLEATGGQSSAVYPKLAKQAELLNNIVGQQKEGFSSVTMEIRNSERALQTLRAAGYADTEMFRQFQNATQKAAQAQKELQREEKLLESQAPLLEGMVLAVKGLAGAYAVGQGAAMLFADGNEHAQKQLNKLVAIMTIMQGLQQAYELIQNAGSIALAIRTALLKLATKAMGEHTAATVEAATAAAVNTEAVDVEAMSYAELAAAVKESEVALAASKRALIATGIGAAIIAIAAAIAYLMYRISEWSKGTELTVKEQGELAEAVGNANKALAEQSHFIDSLDKSTLNYYENLIKLNDAAGKNEEENFKSRKARLEEEKSLAESEITRLGASSGNESAAAGNVTDLQGRIAEAQNINAKILKTPDHLLTSEEQRRKEGIKVNIETLQKQLDAAKNAYDEIHNARKRLYENNQAIAEEELRQEKFIAEEKSKIAIAGLNAIADATEAVNARILGDDRSMEKERLAAMDSNLEAARLKIEAARLAVVNNPGSSRADVALANTKAEQETLRAIQSTEEEKRKLRYTYYVRYRDAVLGANEDEIKINEDKNEAIINDNRSTFDERLKATSENFESERNILKLELKRDLDQQGLTGEETLRIKRDYAEKNKKLDLDQAKAEHDLIYQNYMRVRGTDADIVKDQQQQRIDANDAILQDDKSTYTERSKALTDSYQANRSIIAVEFLKEIAQEGLNNEDRIKIAEDYETSLKSLDIKRIKDREDLQKADHEKQLKQLEEYYQKRKNLETIENAKAVVALNDQLLSGKIGPGNYDRKRAELDYNEQVRQKQENVTAAEGNYFQAKPGSKEALDYQTALADAQMDLNDTVTDHKKKLIKDSQDYEIQATEKTQEAIVSILDDGYEQQEANIERQIKKNNELGNAQIKRIQNSTLGEQQKANATMLVEKQVAANNLALERREHDIKVKQAKADRDIAVGQILEQAAIAEISALKLPAPYGEIEAIAIGVIAAATIAEVLARPLPTYGYGTDDHIGGLAVVGDRFRRELIAEPGKAARWSPDVPTIMELAPHTKVISHDEIDRMQREGLFVNNQGILMGGTPDKTAEKITEAMIWQTGRLESALSKQKKTMIINNKMNSGWGEYVQKSVFKWR